MLLPQLVLEDFVDLSLGFRICYVGAEQFKRFDRADYRRTFCNVSDLIALQPDMDLIQRSFRFLKSSVRSPGGAVRENPWKSSGVGLRPTCKPLLYRYY